jgi:acyl carrier protein
MPTVEEVIQEILVERLELPVEPAEVGVQVPLFRSVEEGGLGLDSLASLEIISALCEKYDLAFDDVEAEDFRSIATLAAYLRRNEIE